MCRAKPAFHDFAVIADIRSPRPLRRGSPPEWPMSCATSHIWDCARWSPSCLILPRQPFFQTLDRIIAVLEFRIAQQLLEQGHGGLNPLDHIFLPREPEANRAAVQLKAQETQSDN